MEAFEKSNCLCNWDQEAALEEEMARMSLLPPPPLDDFDDISIHTAPENLELTYPDSTDSQPSGDTTEKIPSLTGGSEVSEHDEYDMMQTEPMEIDDGVESYCHRCHLVYHGTKEQHQPERDEHGYCMTHQRLEGPRYGYSRCDIAIRIPIPGPISTLGKIIM